MIISFDDKSSYRHVARSENLRGRVVTWGQKIGWGASSKGGAKICRGGVCPPGYPACDMPALKMLLKMIRERPKVNKES